MADFNDYRWAGISGFTEGGFYHQRAMKFFETVNWTALCSYASSLQRGQKCSLDSRIALGGRHMVRIICFDNGNRWIARLRMSMREPGSEQVTDPDDAGEYNSAWLLQREVDCLRLIKERTEVPVPAIYGYSAQAGNEIGASFMLMECFMGNVGMDLNFDHIPPEYNRSFLAATARIQDLLSEKTTEHTTLGLCQGWAAPLTGLQYSQAWAATAKFPRTDSCITDCCGPFAAEVLSSTHGFTRKIDELAPQLSLVSDQGPFPLCHVDFGHNNIIVDHEYNILAVIDWEHAFASPWETQYFPLTLHVTPPPMDLPENYDENGHPKDDKTKQKLADREFYVSAVRRSEEEGPDAASPALSEALGNDQIQSVVTAMRLFVDGKFGIYSKVLDMFVSSQENMES